MKYVRVMRQFSGDAVGAKKKGNRNFMNFISEIREIHR